MTACYRPTSPTHRRGAALLIVLATLIITMTSMTILVRTASTLQLQRQIEGCRATADDLIVTADAPIQRWLKEEASKVVAPPGGASSSRFEVTDEHFMLNGRECTLRITAFDQLGMVPLDAARGGSPLRLTLPPEVLRVIDKLDRLKNDPKAVAGLDWFASSTDGLPCRVFPAEQETTALPAVGELVATHNGPSVAAGSGVPSININTAPMSLVEAALRLAGRGGFEQVLAARKAGKSANIGSPNRPVSSDKNAVVPQIVTTSNRWAFRIDIRVDPLWRSWWAIYSDLSSGAGWECVQRLAITE